MHQAQLAFSWRSTGVQRTTAIDTESSPRSARGADASGRRVTFTVQNVPPSPLVYHARHYSAGDGGDGEDPPPVKQSDRPTERPSHPPLLTKPPLPKNPPLPTKEAERGATAAPYSAAAKPKPRARPGWDGQVAVDSSLFDTSLKRSALFQARPGDRRRESSDQEKYARDRQGSLSTRTSNQSRQSTAKKRRPSAVPGEGKLIRKQVETRSSGYMTPTSYQLPRRSKKDFVKGNIEQMTGRPGEVLRSDKRLPRPGRSRKVFERLTAPRGNELLARTHGRSSETAIEVMKGGTEGVDGATVEQTPVETSPQATKQESGAQLSIELDQSTINPRTQSSRSPGSSAQLSPQQATTHRQGVYRGASPRSSPSSRQSRNSRVPPQPSYASRVFAVLDREEHKRIGVDQALQGLRLLGLPATHNQISDYVYLIHEGRSSTIDLEEWEILVGTLDAASRPSESAASLARIETSSERSAFSLGSPDRGTIHRSPLSRNSPPRSSLHTRESPSSSIRHSSPNYDHESPGNPSVHSESKLQDQDLEINEDIDNDPDIRAVQRCVDEMCLQAGAATSLHYANRARSSNQVDEDSANSSRHVLNRAAAVVYSLKSSLFPLVHQAEEALREIRQRQGSKLSVVLSPEDLQTVARHSETLASSILDDVLLDTVQLLNDEEKHKTQQQVVALHTDQLDDILSQIQKIEHDELQLLEQQALQPSTTHTNARVSDWEPSHSPVAESRSRPCTSNLVLPLEVLMRVKIPEDIDHIQRIYTPPDALDPLTTTTRALPKESGIQSTLPTIQTSVLQGKRLQSIEKRRATFLKHRRLVEAALTDTGMAQSAVIEVLEELIVMDIIEEAAVELEDTVGTISDTVVTNLL